tara:strand:- start:1905 stop:2228 length:324 start_codon:yes stop_codon:yes gene_type:complete
MHLIYEGNLTYSRLTMDDLVNIRRRDTKRKARVNIGDLIKVTLDKQEFIGIVLKVDDKTMKIQNPQGEIKWISLYVIYEVLQYDNRKGVSIDNKKKDNENKERETKD